VQVDTKVLVNFTCGKQGREFSCVRALGVGSTRPNEPAPAASTTQGKKGFRQNLSKFILQVSLVVVSSFPSLSSFLALDVAINQSGYLYLRDITETFGYMITGNCALGLIYKHIIPVYIYVFGYNSVYLR
jgi:hypothetical protein